MGDLVNGGFVTYSSLHKVCRTHFRVCRLIPDISKTENIVTEEEFTYWPYFYKNVSFFISLWIEKAHWKIHIFHGLEDTLFGKVKKLFFQTNEMKDTYYFENWVFLSVTLLT